MAVEFKKDNTWQAAAIDHFKRIDILFMLPAGQYFSLHALRLSCVIWTID